MLGEMEKSLPLLFLFHWAFITFVLWRKTNKQKNSIPIFDFYASNHFLCQHVLGLLIADANCGICFALKVKVLEVQRICEVREGLLLCSAEHPKHVISVLHIGPLLLICYN